MDRSERLKALNNEKLVDVVRNYRQYGYDQELRESALLILQERGISKEELQLTGNFDNKDYDLAQDIFNCFKRNSRLAFLFYGLTVLSLICMPLLFLGSEILLTIGILFTIAAFSFYFLFLFRSFIDHLQFHKFTGNDPGLDMAMVYLFLGIPFYLFMYFHFKGQMKRNLNSIY